MTISLRGDSGVGAIQVDGIDRLVLDSQGLALNGARYSGYNRLINGDMRLDQRWCGQTASLASGAFVTDRWWVQPSSGTITAQQVSSGLRITGAAGVGDVTVTQNIESVFISDLAGKKVTVSAVLSVSTGTRSVKLTSWIPTLKDNFAAMASQVDHSTVVVTTAPQRFSWTFDLPVESVRGVKIYFTILQHTSASIDITDVQLEEGSVATAFDRRPLPIEVLLCQRYFCKSYNLDVRSGTATNNGVFSRSADSGSPAYLHFGTVKFPMTMRTTPTVTIVNPSTGSAGSVRDLNNNTNRPATVNTVGSSQFTVLISNNAAGTGAVHVGHYIAEAEL